MSVLVLSEVVGELREDGQIPEMYVRCFCKQNGVLKPYQLSDFFDDHGALKLKDTVISQLRLGLSGSIHSEHRRRGRRDFQKKLAGVRKPNAQVSIAALADKDASETEPPTEETLRKTLHGVWERVLTDYGLATHQLVYVIATATLLLAAILSFIFIGFSVFTETDDPVGVLINSLMTLGASVGVNKQQQGNSDKVGSKTLPILSRFSKAEAVPSRPNKVATRFKKTTWEVRGCKG